MKTIGVTDHALVRWLERTGAMDVESIRSMLEASLERAAKAVAGLDQSVYLILADGMVFVVREGMVTTVLDDDGRHQHAHALRRE